MDGEISGEELEATLENGEAPLIVDIRNPREFDRKHIEGSINIPMHDLPKEINRLADAEHVVTVCPHGKASIQAANLITSYEDFDGRVESLSCGLTQWHGPVESNEHNAETSDSTHEAPF